MAVKLIYDPDKDPDPEPDEKCSEVRDSLPVSIFFEVCPKKKEVRITRVLVDTSPLLK